MKYAEASKFGGPEVLTVVEKETPTSGDGMLLVEVQAAGINYTDIAARNGSYPAIPKAPFTPGLEIAGIVREVGKGVEEFKIGDTVAAITALGGGYASHLVIPAATAIPFPKLLDPALVAGVLVQGLTAYLALDQAQVKRGDKVLITAAAGGVGSLAVQLAKAKGATVIGLASESKVNFVKGLGADHVIDYGKPGWAAKVSEVAGSEGVQVFFDSIGDLASEAFPLLGQFGRWIIYGLRIDKHVAPLPAVAPSVMIGKNLSLSGFNLGINLHRVPSALKELFKSLMDGSLKVEVSKYPLADASRVHTLFEGRKTTGKLVLVP